MGKARFRMPCFVHQGSHDNLFVDDRKGYCYCFTCHWHADVVAVVAHFEQVSQGEAARLLQERHHVTNVGSYWKDVQEARRQVEAWRANRQRPPAIVDAGLPDLVHIGSYRGLGRDTLDRFGIRQVPGSDWGAGIFIPIRDHTGRLLGYTIRQHPGRQPKYLNTKGIDKRGLLFGLYENRADIVRAGYALVVEGQFDCMEMWQRGYPAVALMGSNMSNLQAQRLAQVTLELVLMLDGDDAGRQGGREIEEKYSSVFRIRTINLPDGIDPATSTKEHYIKDLPGT
jgi:DNA primase